MHHGQIPTLAATISMAGLAGCVLDPWDITGEGLKEEMSAATYAATHSVPDDQWVSYSVDELIATRGEPDEIFHAIPMGSTFDHGVHIDAYVYGLYNKGPCIDAYVVVEASGQIVRYHCR